MAPKPQGKVMPLPAVSAKAVVPRETAVRLVVTHHGHNDWEVGEQTVEVTPVGEVRSIKRGARDTVRQIVALRTMQDGGANGWGKTGL